MLGERIPRQAGIVTSAQHHRHNQGRLDDGNGQSEDQGAERLADPMRDDFSVIDAGEHSGDEGGAGHYGDRTGQSGKSGCPENS